MPQPKLSVFIATSLDGFIARDDGSIDWLMKSHDLVPPGEDCGYKAFIATVDTLIMGRLSYEKVSSFDEWPYGELPVIILSSQDIEIPASLRDRVSVTSKDPLDIVQQLGEQNIQHVYIDGGLTIQRFLTRKLIDELTITYIPVLLGSGRSLFGSLTEDVPLQLLNSTTFHDNLIQVTYKIEK